MRCLDARNCGAACRCGGKAVGGVTGGAGGGGAAGGGRSGGLGEGELDGGPEGQDGFEAAEQAGEGGQNQGVHRRDQAGLGGQTVGLAAAAGGEAGDLLGQGVRSMCFHGDILPDSYSTCKEKFMNV